MTDDRNHLNKYRNIIAVTKYPCEHVVNNETIKESVAGIELLVRNCQERKRLSLARKLGELLKNPQEIGNRTWVNKAFALMVSPRLEMKRPRP